MLCDVNFEEALKSNVVMKPTAMAWSDKNLARPL